MSSDFPRPPLDATSLRSGCSTRWRSLDVVDETRSTNADLLARAAAGEDIDGAVLLAEYQSAGRGRHGRSWSAPPRSQLALSVGVDTAGVPTAGWGWLPLLTGLAVLDALRSVAGIDAGLKWPNDVLVSPPPGMVGTKLAGILAEVAPPSSAVVLGLGLNVTLTPEEVPDPVATSVLMLGSEATDRTVLASAILSSLGTRIGNWCAAAGPDPGLIADYCAASRTLGTAVRASLPGGTQLEGTAESIDELGRLRIATADGVVTVSAGDITHLRPLAP